MTETEFYKALEILEDALQGQLNQEFTEKGLWPYFKTEEAGVWAETCILVARRSRSVATVILHDFVGAKIEVIRRKSGVTFQDSVNAAIERKKKSDEERRRAEASWKRPMNDIVIEQAEKGNPVARQMLGLPPMEEGQDA